MTGLTAIQQSGEPGYDGATIFVRGKATFTGSTNPLILVDGVERSFGDIDANEIESVSILKMLRPQRYMVYVVRTVLYWSLLNEVKWGHQKSP